MTPMCRLSIQIESPLGPVTSDTNTHSYTFALLLLDIYLRFFLSVISYTMYIVILPIYLFRIPVACTGWRFSGDCRAFVP